MGQFLLRIKTNGKFYDGNGKGCHLQNCCQVVASSTLMQRDLSLNNNVRLSR